MQHPDPLIDNPPEKSEGPFTTVVRRRVKPGKEDEFEQWLKGVTRDAVTFPGHLGVGVIRPTSKKRPEFIIVFRFDTYDHLIGWETSEIRRAWVQRVQPLITGETSVQRMTGLEYWFTAPGHPGSAPPKRWKMATVTWLALAPIVMIVQPLLTPLLAPLPTWLQITIMAAVMVMTMTWIVMPQMTKLFSFWLYPEE
ncbi:MAG: antibiotic biosynthesis monooxygenase [Bacteroidota bacterium]|jgi:antibiotic biosynthesis monooxygenase (ABM) superfamily enzyme|nr:antibiotic biosynthesis monooxygenase [Bacteroidota bacterium]